MKKNCSIMAILLVSILSFAQHAPSQTRDDREKAKEYYARGLKHIDAIEYEQAYEPLYNAWKLDSTNWDYKSRYMYISVFMGREALFAGKHGKALEHFNTAFKLKQELSKEQDVEYVTLKRFIEIAEEHSKYYPVRPDYVYRIQAVYIMNTDLANTFDADKQPVRCKGTLSKNLFSLTDRYHEMLRIYMETLSRGRLSLSFDTQKVDATVTRATVNGRQGKETVFLPDLDSVRPSIAPLLFAGRNTYDTTLYYWYSGNLAQWPWASWESGVPIIPYSWKGSAMRGTIIMPGHSEGAWSGFLYNIAHHFVTFHEFFHHIENLTGTIAPQHAHVASETPKARLNFPEWVPDTNQSWTATEYSWYRYHIQNTVPSRMVELARETGLNPPWRNLSYVNRFPDTTDEELYDTYSSAVKGIEPAEMQKASDLYKEAQQASWSRNPARAMELYQEALKHNPYHIGSLDALGWLAIDYRKNDFETADRHYGTAARVFPNPRNCFQYGLIFFERNQAGRAVPYFRIAARRPDAKPVYAWWAAKALAAAGDAEGAEAMMRRIERHPVVSSPLAFINCKAADAALQAGDNPEDENAPWPWKLYRQARSRWRLVPAGVGQVRIVSEFHWRCLEARGSGSKATVAATTMGKSDAQVWRLSRRSDGAWGITSKTAMLSLAVVPAPAGKQGTLELQPESDSPFQKWEIETHDPAVGAMETLRTVSLISPAELAMDVAGGSMADGTPICQWEFGKDNWNQKWKLVPSGTAGHVLIISARTLKCVAAAESDGFPRPLQQTVTQSDPQLWRLVPKGGGRFLLVNRSNGLALQPDQWNRNSLTMGVVEDTAPQLWRIEY